MNELCTLMSCSCIQILKSSTRCISTTRMISQSLKFLTSSTMSATTKKHLIRKCFVFISCTLMKVVLFVVVLSAFFIQTVLYVDTVCCWYSYGIKEVKGINRLSGAGLETKDSPGILSGGGKWPGRCVGAIYVTNSNIF